MLTNSIFNRFRSMFDKIALPKASSVYDNRKYSNDLTSKEFHKHKNTTNTPTSNEWLNINNWYKAYFIPKEISRLDENDKKMTNIHLVKKTFSRASEKIRMQFENISLDQRNVLGLHFLLNLINRCKWSFYYFDNKYYYRIYSQYFNFFLC